MLVETGSGGELSHEETRALAANMIVKIPVTSAGIEAFEEVTYRGVSINATVRQ